MMMELVMTVYTGYDDGKFWLPLGCIPNNEQMGLNSPPVFASSEHIGRHVQMASIAFSQYNTNKAGRKTLHL